MKGCPLGRPFVLQHVFAFYPVQVLHFFAEQREAGPLARGERKI